MHTHSIPTLTHRATHASFWSALEISTRYGLQLVVLTVLARLLTPSDFGLMAMLLVFTSFAALLVEGGLGSALIQKQFTSANDETSVFLVNLVMACVLAGLLWLLAPAIAGFYGQPRLTAMLHVLLWLLPLGAVATVPNALLSQRLSFRKRAAAELVSSLGSALLALWLAWSGFGVWSLVWQVLAGAGLRALLLWWISGWRPRGRFERAAFSGLFRFGGYLLLANALNVTTLRLQSLLIGRLFDARILGFYSMAQDTQQAPAQFISSLLNRVGLPMFAAVVDQPAKLTGALRLALRLSMFVFAPCMICIAVLAKPLVLLVYGPQWLPTAPMLSILALATVFWPLHLLNLAAITALGRSGIVFKLEIIKALSSIPLVLGASIYGPMAVCWAVMASNSICVLINTRYSRALLNCGLRMQLHDLLPGFLLTVMAAAAAWLASGFANRPWLDLGLAVSAAITAYLTGAIVFRPKAWRELLVLLHTLRFSHPDNAEGTRT